jgi:RES domain-containing protein
MAARFEPDPVLLDRLAQLEHHSWSGTVWRHTLADYPADSPNTRGARWNPKGVEALYTSLDRATAIAEGDYLIQSQPVLVQAKRTIHRLEVGLKCVADLTAPGLLASMGVDVQALEGDEFGRCQAIGGAAAFLKLDGIVVPSARSPGHNLVILFENSDESPEVQVVDSEPLA